MKQRIGRLLSTLLLTTFSLGITAGVIKGTIIDKQTKEPLTGATVQVTGSATGAVADLNGNYTLTLNNGTYTLEVKYIGYKTFRMNEVKIKTDATLNFELEVDAQTLDAVTVVARKNLEGEKALLQERQKATLAIENMGAKEMTLKGISNVQDGVKKITGISIASAGQLIVRGLGDRYSTTTLNGLPIASPNPDNKLIPLDLFPASTVKNITVSKVYAAGSFADYSGAHIDISTKENTGSDFFSIGFNVGGRFNTIGKDFYYSDRKGGLFSTGNLKNKDRILAMGKSEFRDYARNNDPFGTNFAISKHRSLPEFGGNLGGGKSWTLPNGNRLSLLASVGISNENQILKDAYVTTMTAQGTHLDKFNYDSYSSALKIAGLGSIGYSFRQADHINFTLFYARNAINDYMAREGIDAEKNNITSSNSVFHAYSLLNNQLMGYHELTSQWDVNWSASYGLTNSDEPDRRQVVFFRNEGSDKLNLFKLNQTTNRYFGELQEKEIVGDLRTSYKWGDANLIRVGGTYKSKKRDFESVNFYYDINALNADVTNIYDTNGYLNQENIANGTIKANIDAQPRYNYYAGMDVWAGFAEIEYYPVESLLVNVGLRYEQAKQWVRYWTDGGQEKKTNLDKGDFFPALNLKYTIDETNSLRLSVSRTVTRPSFIEMAPFLYQESYGSAYIRGNNELKNAYNYNIDLRYDFFPKRNNGDMFSVTGYFKKLKSPIEQTQESSGGTVIRSFRNAEDGIATGVEIEFRKELFKNLRIGANGSYMYTNVILPEGGVYTDSERALQGASPFLINADISYTPQLRGESDLTLALVYNVQGPRIETVGIYGTGNIKQQTLHTMDFIASYAINKHLNLRLQMKDLLNSTIRFKQELPATGQKVEVESFRPGTNAEIGVSYRF
ncbi:TonB-dependent receptor [Bacteroides fragilis]|jgi:outer membrane receptor protein involved in Fe transport|uniref:TonB-dependent receptor n=1 Tax=Bacteroides TaxID=816 RepID=UPI0020304209|nr:TonB-dependent receptor [Bacteroides fragilis]MCE8588176.1 TonB-dependent receptor [Bacteroides fragilis]MCE8592277.1 TonB-dependent receptor [Bacteroides fragilis]MCE8659675.1 TonB-dependent receptor [Bacteroides fragilis]MCE8662931.1 TonB-dependent receptor [Bacteroides fragilis]MCM0246165.1 TonB-dependent receptor [Bacteroides fragilis]